MRILLHIGSPKTGTTSLQHWLAAGRGSLAAAGVLYPDLDPRKPQHHRLSLLPRFDRPPRMFAGKGLDAAARRRLGEDCLAALRAQRRAARCETLILSTECLFDEVTPERGAALLERLRGPGDRVEVLCYLRDPVGYFLSRTGQKLRASHRLPRLAAPDYLASLAAFAAADRLHLFDHGRVMEEHDGDITGQFAARFLGGAAVPPAPGRRNESLSAEGIDILWSYRRAVHGDRPDTFRKDSGALYRHLLAAEATVPDRAPLRARSPVERHLRAGFAAQARGLRERYGLELRRPDPGPGPEAEGGPAAPGAPPPAETPAEVFCIDPGRRERLLNALLRRLLVLPPGPPGA